MTIPNGGTVTRTRCDGSEVSISKKYRIIRLDEGPNPDIKDDYFSSDMRVDYNLEEYRTEYEAEQAITQLIDYGPSYVIVPVYRRSMW